MRNSGLIVAGIAAGVVGCASAIPMVGGRYHDAPFTEARMTGTVDRPVASGLGVPGRAAPALSAEIPRRLASAESARRKNAGWRLGWLYVDGDLGDWLEREYDAGPWIFAWGYQFEVERGAAGQTTALVTIVPSIAGLDESMFIPSVNVLVGLRFPNRFEIGAGPHYAPRVYSDKESYPSDDLHLWGLGLTLGGGYTFETNDGRMRIPVNVAAGLAADGTMLSVTIGWNMEGW